MGKVWDFLLTNSWKEYQEVRTQKRVRKFMDDLSEDDLDGLSKEELKEVIKKLKK